MNSDLGENTSPLPVTLPITLQFAAKNVDNTPRTDIQRNVSSNICTPCSPSEIKPTRHLSQEGSSILECNQQLKSDDQKLSNLAQSFSNIGFKPGMLELCAGSATLSFVGQQKGLLPIPIDHSRNKFHPKVPIIKMNLADEATADICIEQINSGAIPVVTAAVPCGTATRAREIPLPGGPMPLRSDDHPYGQPDLVGVDLLRVETANKIYMNAQRILVAAHYKHCICALENPDRSILCMLLEIMFMLTVNFVDVVFQHCKWSPPSQGYESQMDQIQSEPKRCFEVEGSLFTETCAPWLGP